MKFLKRYTYLPETLIFIFAAFTRFFRLNIPSNYMFDEVYHAFTASEMFKGNPAAWEWWNTPPKGLAYEWTHPPVAKEFMVLAIRIFGDNSFAWRFFSAFFGTLVIVLIYLIAKKLFKNRLIALFASLFASLDGLLLVMSRIGMNDMYFLFFALLAFYLFLHKKYFLMGISLGISLASKWTGLFTIEIIGLLWLSQLVISIRKNEISKKQILINFLKAPLYFLIIPVIIYLFSYAPFFAGHHTPPGTNMTTFQTFIELQQQMYWYHTNLKATHTYQSVPIQWIFNIRPVWLYVDYKPDSIANIYTLGNPFFMWGGLFSMFYLFYEYIKKRKFETGLVLLSYFGFFVPWIFSPRIMFHYHYLPSVPFLAIGLGYSLFKTSQNKNYSLLVFLFIPTLIVSFIYFFPLWTAIHVPLWLNNSYYWLPTWK